MKLLQNLSLMMVLGGLYASVMAAGLDVEREAAQKAFNQGNYKDAAELYVKLLERKDNVGKDAAMDFNTLADCLMSLNRISEYDALLIDNVSRRKKDWKFIVHVGNMPEKNGFIIDNKFTRGNNRRGQGQYIDVSYADYLRNLQWKVGVMPYVDHEDVEAISYYAGLAENFEFGKPYMGGIWSYTVLTDLTQKPDYLHPYMTGSHVSGVPADEQGNPVFFHCPKSFGDAKNDGERIVWCRRKAMDIAMKISEYPDNKANLIMQLADFYSRLYDVSQLGGGFYGMDQDTAEDIRDGILSLETLRDDESIIRLATGVKRFTLPEDCNYIKLYEQAAAVKSRSVSVDAYRALARIYENRRQYGKALAWWRTALKIADGNGEDIKESIEKITGNWCRLEDVRQQVAGDSAVLTLVFRNARKAIFKAYRLDMDQIVEDCQKYLANLKGVGNDWNQREFTNLAWRLYEMEGGEKKYLKELYADWSMDLEPAADYHDRRVTVTAPLRKAGWYVVICDLEDGKNQSRVPVYLADTEIVRTMLKDGRTMWQVLDTRTGHPLSDMQVDFFSWSSRWNDKNKREERSTTRFSEITDGEGKIVLGDERMSPEKSMDKNSRNSFNYAVHAVVRGKDGRRAWYPMRMYNRGYWHDNLPDRRRKAFFLTDRPVYRPGQKVEFKFWVGRTSYEDEDKSVAAGLIYDVDILEPRGGKVKEYKLKADSYGGINATFELPEDARLGVYRVRMQHGVGTFRVEEYKKPEFEVTVETPREAPRLGDKFELTIKARYYFGAPVTEGTATVKVLRSTHRGNWWPSRPWDWFYGSGYWWFWSDYAWYPGWAKWGCCCPRRPWFGGFSYEAPEVVAQVEKKLNADGTVKLTIDTTLAKELLGDRDHKYDVTATVVDSSRREIHGGGSVTVARRPFTAHVWMDCGYGLVGDKLTAFVQARTLDGAPVVGKGKLALYRVSYEAQGKAQETLEREWELDTNERGSGSQVFSASRAGQYRLGWTVTDAQGRSAEGGLLFTVCGTGYDDGRDFRYNGLELIPDKPEYAPGETVRLMVSTELSDSVVMLFIRATAGRVDLPQVLHLKGKSQIVEIPIEKKDMPNIHIEAYTMANGTLHQVIREIAVPPEKKILNVEVKPVMERAKPGMENPVKIQVTDLQGKPYRGSMVVSVYDKSLEYISGGSNIGDIKSFFWKWRRHHSLSGGLFRGWPFGHLWKEGDNIMETIGMYAGSPRLQALHYAGGSGADGLVRARREMGAKANGAMFAASTAAAARGGMAPVPMMDKAKMAPAKPAAAEAPAMAEMSEEAMDMADVGGMVEPAVRTKFADTALWIAGLETDERGQADIKIPMPENLSTWKVRVWAMGWGTRVGEGSAEIITAKDLIVRLEAPRFFVQKDEVVLSAIAHNYLKNEKKVDVELKLGGDCLKPKDKMKKTVKIPAGGETRVDWTVEVVKDGEAVIQMRALTDEESDAMEQKFSVYVHGADKQVACSGVLRPDQKEAKLKLEIPRKRRLEDTKLEIRWSPSLALAMIDAVPYLVDYPYGCTEQTLNRFLPAAQTRHVIRRLGVPLAEIKAARNNLNAQEIGKDDVRKSQWKRLDREPVFDEDELDKIIKKGLKDLSAMQCSDGGWGWFSGWGERSWPHTTAQVVMGLKHAEACKLVVPADVLKRGIGWLKNYQDGEVGKLKLSEKDLHCKRHADNLDAMVYRILCECGIVNGEMEDFLYRDKAKSLSAYGLALFGLGLHYAKDKARLADVMHNLSQYLVQDDENQTAWMNIGDGYWWCWYGDEIETQAAYLKLLAETEPLNETASRLVKYLLNNRKHATYWRSTRDTAACLDAFATYLDKTGEMKPDMDVEILLDGKVVASSHITERNLFTADLTAVLKAEQLTSGKHELTVRRNGQGPLYFNAYLSYFTLEDFIEKTGLEVKVERRVYKLVRNDKMVDAANARGQAIKQRVEQYKRIPVKSGEKFKSGDLLEVELIVDSKNDYEYLLMEDYKAAGTEAVEQRSGYNGNSMGAYVEFHDAKVSFFLRTLARGKHSLSYRLRAEIPGKFSALPTQISGMYAPELRGNSDEFKLKIQD